MRFALILSVLVMGVSAQAATETVDYQVKVAYTKPNGKVRNLPTVKLHAVFDIQKGECEIAVGMSELSGVILRDAEVYECIALPLGLNGLIVSSDVFKSILERIQTHLLFLSPYKMEQVEMLFAKGQLTRASSSELEEAARIITNRIGRRLGADIQVISTVKDVEYELKAPSLPEKFNFSMMQ